MFDEMLYGRHFERMERNRWMLTKDVPWEQLQPDLDTELPKLRLSFDPGPAVQPSSPRRRARANHNA